LVFNSNNIDFEGINSSLDNTLWWYSIAGVPLISTFFIGSVIELRKLGPVVLISPIHLGSLLSTLMGAPLKRYILHLSLIDSSTTVRLLG